MSLPTVTIQGPLRTPSGHPVRRGSVSARLSQSGRALDGDTPVLVAPVSEVWSGSSDVSIALVPNDLIQPPGTTYVVAFSVLDLSGRPSNWTERWRVSSAAPVVALADVERVSAVPAAVVAGPPGQRGPEGPTGPVGETAGRSVKQDGALGDGTHDDSGAFGAALSGVDEGGNVIVPASSDPYLITTQLTLRDYLRIGGAPSGVRVRWDGPQGRFLDFESTVNTGTVVDGLRVEAATRTVDHVIEYRNSALVTSSASGLQLRDLTISGAAAGKAALHLLGIKPAGGEGNVYGITTYNLRCDRNRGHGIWFDSRSVLGAAGTALTNLWAGSASGNAGSGLLFDTSQAGSSAHGLANVWGTLLQGNTQAAIRAASVGNLNLIGSYFEQTAGAPQVSGSGAQFPNGPWLLLGNNVGNSGTAPDYNFDLGGDTGFGVVGLVSACNTISNARIANYNIRRLKGAIIGPDRTSASGNSYVDWVNSWAWQHVLVFDVNAGTLSFSSDRRYSEQPKVGLGIKGPDIAAQVHIGGEKTVQDPASPTAVPALRVDGVTDLQSLRLKSPDGSLWQIKVGNDGTLSTSKVV